MSRRTDCRGVESPTVSIVIPSLNTCHLLEQCLASFAGQSVWPECEAIVVDMASTDGTAEMLAQRFPDVQVLADVPNRGYGAACNVGAASSHGKWLLMVNSDVALVQTDSIGLLLQHACSRSGDALFGVRLVGRDGVPQRSAHALPSRWCLPLMFFTPLRYVGSLNGRALGYLDEQSITEDTPVGWVSGALLLIRTELFKRMDGFDERFFMNSEEVDLAARVAELGGEVVFVPDVTVLHHGGGSTSSRGDGLRWLAEGHVRYTRKHFGNAFLLLARAAAIGAYLLSLPVWVLRALLGRQQPSEAAADSRAFAYALGRALCG